jgi:hypothetical protein
VTVVENAARNILGDSWRMEVLGAVTGAGHRQALGKAHAWLKG